MGSRDGVRVSNAFYVKLHGLSASDGRFVVRAQPDATLCAAGVARASGTLRCLATARQPTCKHFPAAESGATVVGTAVAGVDDVY